MTQVADSPVAAPAVEASRSSDNPKIVDAIQAHLDAFADIEAPAVETPAETPAAEATPVEPEVQTPEGSSESVAPAAESPEAQTPEAAAAPAVSTLPAAYVRTAKARGWTDDEISAFTKQGPEVALKTFERMHESRTKEITEWADLGRKIRQGGPVAQPATGSTSVSSPQPATTGATTVVATPALQPINVDEMVQKFGNEELIRALAGPVNAAIAAVAPLMQQATTSQAEAKRTQSEALGKMVEDFFTAKEMAPFAESYGKGNLTSPQIEKRSKVLETADALISGAAYQGRKLSVQDALMLAHDSVSSGLKETIIREKIRTSVVKRAAGLTLKPTAQGRATVGGPPRDRQELFGRTEGRLQKAFA